MHFLQQQQQKKKKKKRKRKRKMTSGLYVDTDATQLYLTKARAVFQRFLNLIVHCLNSTS